jgi:hypothetical protein
MNSPQRVDCEFTTVSEAISEYRIDHIDLLKVDVEGAELDVLQGIADSDWPRIRQEALEAHTADRADRVRELLEHRGFKVVVVEPNDSWRLPALFGCRMVYARR